MLGRVAAYRGRVPLLVRRMLQASASVRIRDPAEPSRRYLHAFHPRPEIAELGLRHADRQPVNVLLSATTSDRLPAIQAATASLRGLAPPDQLPILLGGQVVRGRERELRLLGVIPISEPDVASALTSIVAVAKGAAPERSIVRS